MYRSIAPDIGACEKCHDTGIVPSRNIENDRGVSTACDCDAGRRIWQALMKAADRSRAAA